MPVQPENRRRTSLRMRDRKRAAVGCEAASGPLADLPVRDWEVEDERPFWTRLVAGMASTGGILGEISLSTGPKLYSIGP